MIWIQGPAGPLAALLDRPDSNRTSLAAVFGHPHPQHGGTMHNKVVYAAASAARELEIPVLRFNFRGVGGSAGYFDGGRGEIDDMRSALDHLARAYPGRSLVAGGFSFGAWVAAVAGRADDRVAALVSIGTPIGIYGAGYLRDITKPALFVQADADEFGPVEELAEVVRGYRGPARLVRVEGTGHLFADRTDQVQAAVRDFLREMIAADRRKEAGSQG
jgi:alpha/beta superfamily hydrolase